MSSHRNWMYNRFRDDGLPSNDFLLGVKSFLKAARKHARKSNLREFKCPCNNCRNVYFRSRSEVENHLCKNGFVRGYEIWVYHGEQNMQLDPPVDVEQPEPSTFTTSNEYVNMVREGMNWEGMNWDSGQASGFVNEDTDRNDPEDPNPTAAAYYNLLETANEPLYDGCTEFTKLGMVSQLLNLKAESNISQVMYERWVDLLRRALPNKGVTIPADFYEAKKMLGALFLPKQKIHACVNNCMLFYKEYEGLITCKICGQNRYESLKVGQQKPVARKVLTYLPITPRLQRLYMSSKTASDMIWHVRSQTTEGWMTHPKDGEAWKYFDKSYPDFASEPRNVRIGLCTDGFQAFSGKFGGNYSCWPVIICVYNLPPGLCMKDPYMMLTLICPGPDSPGRDLDVFLRPLVDELKSLWEVGVVTYDAATKQNFTMKASLMWTISDFPAYGMLSGWSTHGRLSCPYCMNATSAFYLQKGRKHSWFDCHRPLLRPGHPFRSNRTSFYKGRTCEQRQRERLSGGLVFAAVRTLNPDVFGKLYAKPQFRSPGYGELHNWTKKSIFWELPYWPKQKVRHNIDFMHTEKNNGDNMFHTVMDMIGKTKDNANARSDVETHCSRKEMHLVKSNGKLYKPKAKYSLDPAQQKAVREWFSNLKFPDGYASNIARAASNPNFVGLKSLDVHILVQRLIPVMTRHLIPDIIWETITELCNFFRDLSSTTLHVDHVKQLEVNIVEIICKMEKIFPPAYFDVMEHLPIHMPYEALNGGPVQYRWMYPFEAYLGRLKRMIRQKARIEGSICEAYLVNEVADFCSLYFEETVATKMNMVGRYDEGMQPEDDGRLSIFRHIGRPTTIIKSRYYMDDTEYNTAHVYILSNTPEVEKYLMEYNALLDELNYTAVQKALEVRENFGQWFHSRIQNTDESSSMKSLSAGPNTEIKRYKGYYVNGFYFAIGSSKTTYNSGVCVKGSYNPETQLDYYGVLQEIWELTYGSGLKIVLFKCDWFDTEKYMRVHRNNGMVEIKHKSRAYKDDSFILASQAQQVYYLSYVSKTKDHKDWYVAVKTKARSRIDSSHTEHVDLENLKSNDVFQEDQQQIPTSVQSRDDLDDPHVIVDTEHFIVCDNVSRRNEEDEPEIDDDSEESKFEDDDEDE